MSDTISELRADWGYYDEIDRQFAKRNYCENCCEEHNEHCFYYDAEEEFWDYEQCYKDSNGWR